MSISNSVSAAGSTPPATPDSDLDPFMPSEGEGEQMEMEKFELLGCYTSLPFTVVEKKMEITDPEMSVDICFEVCKEYVIAGLWNDSCICGMDVPSPSDSDWPDPFLPAPSSQPPPQSQTLLHLHLHLHLQEQTQEREPEAGVCNLPCPGNTNQICGGGVEAVVRKRERREEGVRWSVYHNLNLTLLNGDGNVAANRYRYTDILATETGTGTGNVTSNSNGNNNATTMVSRSAATRTWRRGLSLTYLSVVGVVVSAVLLGFL
jgi:hypothetical protein